MRAYTWIISVIFALAIDVVPVTGVEAGWKSKAAFGGGTVIAGKALKKCITSPSCKQAGLEKVKNFLVKHPELRDKTVDFIQKQATTKYKDLLQKSPTARENYRKILYYVRGSGRKSGVPSEDFKPTSKVTELYKRNPKAGPTKEQTTSFQGKPCVNCGNTTPKQVADHKKPLVVEHYEKGAVDISAQRRIEAVQPHCPNCSNQQGGQLGQFGKGMKRWFEGRQIE